MKPVIVAGLALATWSSLDPKAYAGETLPEGFAIEVVAGGTVNDPVDVAFLPGDRLLVLERSGLVHVFEGGIPRDEPFIDMRPEVNNAWDRGMLGIATDPEFETNPWVYMVYVVDPIYGQPDESGFMPSHGRVTRYLADPANDHETADLSSRQVLIGEEPAEGLMHCHSSHSVGMIQFGPDGALYVSVGDGAHWDIIDAGGHDPNCFQPPLSFDNELDTGAFRSQQLDAMAGKILRIDRNTGLGLSDNPFWTGNGSDNASKVWMFGLRNPYRFTIEPNSGMPPRIIVGDVGYLTWEELNVGYGGENFGWPCYEGNGTHADYFPAGSVIGGCDNLDTEGAVGHLTMPTVTWHHFFGGLSVPSGFTGTCVTAGSFYTGTCYPQEYRNRFFFSDWLGSWIRSLTLDAAGELDSFEVFGTGFSSPVAIKAHPETGDLYLVEILAERVIRIVYEKPISPFFDCDADGDVDLLDFVDFQFCFTGTDGGPVPEECACNDPDIDGDVDLIDFLQFQLAFTGSSM
jgi:glucose/arabinose dehydrogenase